MGTTRHRSELARRGWGEIESLHGRESLDSALDIAQETPNPGLSLPPVKLRVSAFAFFVLALRVDVWAVRYLLGWPVNRMRYLVRPRQTAEAADILTLRNV